MLFMTLNSINQRLILEKGQPLASGKTASTFILAQINVQYVLIQDVLENETN